MALAKPSPGRRGQRHARRGERGFTLIELLISLSVLLIGISGILAMHLTSMRATAYSRHATEASVLGEDKMEELRTIPVESIPVVTPPLDPDNPGTWGYQKVDAQGIDDVDGFYEIFWGIHWDPTDPTVGAQIVTVNWTERGVDSHAIVFRTKRSLTSE